MFRRSPRAFVFIEDPPRISVRLGRITPTLSSPACGGGYIGGCLVRYKRVFDIGCDRRGIALGGIAPTTAAARFEDQHIVGVDHQTDFLGSDRARWLIAGIEHITVRQAVLAAENAAG